jgi:hypothetical protein
MIVVLAMTAVLAVQSVDRASLFHIEYVNHELVSEETTFYLLSPASRGLCRCSMRKDSVAGGVFFGFAEKKLDAKEQEEASRLVEAFHLRSERLPEFENRQLGRAGMVFVGGRKSDQYFDFFRKKAGLDDKRLSELRQLETGLRFGDATVDVARAATVCKEIGLTLWKMLGDDNADLFFAAALADLLIHLGWLPEPADVRNADNFRRYGLMYHHNTPRKREYFEIFLLRGSGQDVSAALLHLANSCHEDCATCATLASGDIAKERFRAEVGICKTATPNGKTKERCAILDSVLRELKKCGISTGSGGNFPAP